MFEEAVKKSITVDKTKITHDDLVDLLSTAFYDNYNIGMEYDKDVYDTLPAESKEGDCIEDIAADLLLSGHHILVLDMESLSNEKEELEDLYQDSPTEHVDSEWGGRWRCGYKVTLDDIVRAMENPECERAVRNFLTEECDLYDGDAIMQTAAFGEIIFG